jgi:hypothetical protein
MAAVPASTFFNAVLRFVLYDIDITVEMNDRDAAVAGCFEPSSL